MPCTNVKESGGTVVECLARDRGVTDWSLVRGTESLLRTGSIQEDSSWHE